MMSYSGGLVAVSAWRLLVEKIEDHYKHAPPPETR